MEVLTRLLRIVAPAMLIVAWPVWNGMAAGNALDQQLSEAQVRAGFLYNCALFVAWPSTAFMRDELVIGVVGDLPLSETLEDMGAQTVSGRKVIIAPVRSLDDLRDFQILFIAGDDPKAVRNVLTKVGGAPILTVGEQADFTAAGGVVRLYTDNGRLRFEINMTHAEGAGLRVSSKMLGLAKIVR